MQQRHKDRRLYFKELANTSREFYIDYIDGWFPLGPDIRILEIGCGEGGNLLPFAEKGCQVTGIDINERQTENAKLFFEENHQEGKFIASDFLLVPLPTTDEEKYDVVLIHDVIEHIEAPYKAQFFERLKEFMRHDALVFFAFPAWQMPFGGHQQICVHALSKVPFIHLLPAKLYRSLLKMTGESESAIAELLSIKRSQMPIEKFEKLVREANMIVLDHTLWFINPHYRQKFGLKPRQVVSPLNKLKWIRNFYTTSAWYLLRKEW